MLIQSKTNFALKNIISKWKQNVNIAKWYNPNSNIWIYPRVDLPIVIDNKGNELLGAEQRKAWWNKLVKESNNKLKKEDEAARKIYGAIAGYLVRRKFNNYNKI